MQTTSITSAAPANRFLNLKARFSQIKKWLLPSTLLLSLAFFAVPASAQVNINAEVPTNPFSNYQVFFNVTFTTAQTGLSASNFTLTGTVTGASIQSVSGSGTSWGVTVQISNSYQSSGTLILNMVNNTGVSPGVSGLPIASPSVTDVLYPLTGSATLTSFNANPGYAKTGDVIGINVISDNYNINQVMGSAGTGADFAANSANGKQGGVSVTLASNFNIPQGPLAYSFSFNTIYSTQGGGSGTSGIIFDSIDPTVSISAPSTNIVGENGTIEYAVTYSDANLGSSNLTTSGITLNTTGTATGTVAVNSFGNVYSVTISNISGNGTLGISVGASYGTDLAGNTDTGAGPSSTVSVLANAAPSISYTGPQAYPTNAAISPLTPTSITGMSAFTTSSLGSSSGLALDYNGNAYTKASNGFIYLNPPGNGAQVLAYNGGNAGTTNIAIASVSSTTSTIIFGAGPVISAIDYTNGVFQSRVNIVPEGAANLVAATHPVSGPEIAMICEGNTSQITFITRTAGVWSAPSSIANAFTTTALAINTFQGGLKMACVGTDNNLYYATYSGGAWSPVAAWATPNIGMSGVSAFTLDTQGNVWYCSGTSLYVLTPGSNTPITITTLPIAPNAIAFDIAGNLYVNFGSLIGELQVPGGFQVNPALPAGLSINSTTGVISGTPTTLTPATNYTVTATAGSANLTAAVNIATITTPALSYGGAQNYVLGTTITPITPTSTSIMPQKYNGTPATFASVSAPTGLAIDAAGNVYVNQSAGTTGVSKIPAAGGTPTPLNVGYPGPIYVDAAGNLYVPNSPIVQQYTFAMYPPGASTTVIFGGPPSPGHSFTNSQGIAVDQAGNAYVGSASSNTVYEYPYYLSAGGFAPVVIATGFTSISGVAVDATGDVYVSDAGAGSIDVIAANRGQWTTLATGLGVPANLCIDGAGNLYFSDNSANTISEIPAGSPVGTGPVLIASGLGTITALAIDGHGDLFAADNTNSVIDKFYPTGGYYINPVLPAGLNFNGATGVISGTPVAVPTIAGTTNYTITAYNTLGSASATQNIIVPGTLPTLSYSSALSFTTGEAGAPLTPTSSGVAAQGYNTIPVFMDYSFNAPFAVAVDTSLNVYVADPYNFTAGNLSYGINGNYGNYVFTKFGGQPKHFTPSDEQLAGVAIDSTGNVFGAKSYAVPSKFTPTTLGFTETALPFGSLVDNVATDAHGDLFGTGGTSVQELALNATSTTTVGSGFSQPTGIAVDGLGNIFVVDRGTNTLYKIPAGSPVGTVPTAVATGFNSPWQMAADGTDNIFIADGGNGVVKELPAGGGAVTTVISNLKTPNGVAVDVNGMLYVADAGFQQVRKYAPAGGYYISPALPAGLSFNNSTGVISGTPTTVTPVKNYKITAYNLGGSTQTIVRFGVTTPSSNLAGLTVSTGSLSPAFATGTLGYSVSVPYTTQQIAVTPTAVDGMGTVTVNGAAVAYASTSAPIALQVGANTINIVVTASDNSSTQTYTVTVTRGAPSNNALLSGAGIGYVMVDGNVEAVVTPTTADPTAMVTVNGVAVVSGSASSPIPLSPGSNTIIITVTAQNGVNKLTYKISVEGPLSGISTLSSLTISAGTLSPSFSGSTTSYTDNVTNTVVSVTVTPTTTDANATVTVNNATVASGTPSGPIALNLGNNTISTLVTAQDGVTTTTYTITVNRIASTNDNLSTLQLSGGTLSPAFATGTTSYNVTVANSVASVTVTPTTADPTATVTVNSAAVISGSASGAIPLAEGAQTVISTVVTAQDGVTTQTYTITVTRAGSSNANLANLQTSSGSLSPAFASATQLYTTSVANTVSSIQITPTAADPNATVTINGTTTASGAASAGLPLAIGPNYFTIKVTPQIGPPVRTYTIVVTRVKSADATLAGLAISTGTLSPAFTAATTSYTAPQAYATTTVRITPTANNSGAVIKVNGTAVASGATSASIPLNTGNNTVTVAVTSQDGSTTDTYTLSVVRTSPNANLSNIVISSGTLTPAFATATSSYTASVINSVTSIKVTPTTSDAAATVTVNSTAVKSGTASAAIPLIVGSNVIVIKGIAFDGTMKTYAITVTRPKSSNANLANLAISSGTLTPVFAAATSSYTASVGSSVASLQVTPTTSDPTATVTVNSTAVASGAASAPATLVAGPNYFTIKVTAQDGTVKTYAITVTKAKSSDATLANLAISSGTLTPAFASATNSYTAAVAYTTTTIKVTPTINAAGATVKVNGTAVASGSASASIALNTGYNTITTVVTAQDGSTTDTYTIIITRTSPVANLSNLTISSGTLSPVFATNTSSYTDAVSNAATSVTITPTTSDAAATVTVNGAAVTSGTASGALPLVVGSNAIVIKGIAFDGTVKTYVVTVTRSATPGMNSLYEPVSVVKPAEIASIEDDGIMVHQGVSPNGDGINDFLTIDGITNYPDNHLMIINRNGVLIYETKGYDNQSRVFDGHSNKTGVMQLPGTYFYSLDYKAGNETKHKTGFIVLKY